MHLIRLQAFDLRCFQEFDLTPVPGVNLLLGANGAGKTSILEAIHILGYGRSFRGRIRDGLIRQGASQIKIQTRWLTDTGMPQQAGIQHTGSNWQARMNGADVDNLGRFCEQFPVLSFDPGSHELIIGASEVRRRFVDWALFHVEPEFHPVWRRFNRALKQRNALLKTQPSAQELASWDQEFAEAGEALHHLRKIYLKTLEPVMQGILSRFLPECGELGLSYSAGWREQQLSLQDALRLNRDRDIQSGFCGVGPHRADWQPSLDGRLQQDHFSRGQAKLLALAALLAQTEDFVAKKGFWPILCFDDLASELDQTHFNHVLSWLAESRAQIWISGTESLPTYQERFPQAKMFHVEHGQVRDSVEP